MSSECGCATGGRTGRRVVEKGAGPANEGRRVESISALRPEARSPSSGRTALVASTSPVRCVVTPRDELYAKGVPKACMRRRPMPTELASSRTAMPLLRLLPFDAALAEALMHGLAQAGHDSAQWTLAEAMAHLGAAALDGAPEQVVHLLIVGPPEQHEGLLLERLSAARAALPGPISLIGPAVRSLQAWLQAGLSGWWPASAATDAQALAAFIEVDRYRWQREAILRADTAQAQEQIGRAHV